MSTYREQVNEYKDEKAQPADAKERSITRSKKHGAKPWAVCILWPFKWAVASDSKPYRKRYVKEADARRALEKERRWDEQMQGKYARQIWLEFNGEKVE